MRDPVLNTASFPTVHCQICDKSVLTYIVINDSGDEIRACVHCDSPIEAEVEWIGADALEERGYQIGKPPPAKSGGCGSGGCGCAVKNGKQGDR